MISRRTVLLMLTTVAVFSNLPAWAAGGRGGPVRSVVQREITRSADNIMTGLP